LGDRITATDAKALTHEMNFGNVLCGLTNFMTVRFLPMPVLLHRSRPWWMPQLCELTP
jgi:hypothetical protein